MVLSDAAARRQEYRGLCRVLERRSSRALKGNRPVSATMSQIRGKKRAHLETVSRCTVSSLLRVFALGRGNPVLAVLPRDGTRHSAFLAAAATNSFVVLLLASLVLEIVGDFFAVFLHLDDGLAFLGLLQLALGA